MTQMHKGFLLIGVFLYAAFVAPKIYAATPDAVNQVLQQGLPAQPAALATLTEALKKEYEAGHNVVALVLRLWLTASSGRLCGNKRFYPCLRIRQKRLFLAG